MKSILTFLFLISFFFSQDRDLLGDLNQDGEINILDIIRTVEIVLENPPAPTEYELWAGDVNTDENINILDIVLLVDYILENINCPEFSSICNYNYTECCPDTTIHNFTFEIDTLNPEGFIDFVYDVFVLDTNNIWCVGDFDIDDEVYGGAHWDGTDWSFIQFIDDYYDYRPQGIWAFSDEEIWLATGNVAYYDGDTTITVWEPEWWINDETAENVWAYDRDNIFFVGYEGLILYFNGEEFIEMESNTDVYLRDIWGTDLNNIWAVGTSSGSFDTVVLHYDGESWEIYYYWDWGTPVGDSNLEGMFRSVWAYEDRVYLFGNGIWINQLNTDDEWEHFYGFEYGPRRIRGNDLEDIYVSGFFRTLGHFNGLDWVDLGVSTENYDNLRGLSVIPNRVVAIGNSGEILNKGFVIRGVKLNRYID